MALTLYAHPFSSYCQKVLIALYENAIPFEFRMLAPDDAQVMDELEQLWPFRRFPVLVDDGKAIMESSIIIEHLQLRWPGPVRLIPADDHQALEVRFMDRFFDNYLSTPQQRIVYDALRPASNRDPQTVAEACAMLDTAYHWLEKTLTDRHLTSQTWAAGGDFSLADCAAAPALFYAHWTHPIPPALSNVHRYLQRLLARPSIARIVDEARPYRPFFPINAPPPD